MRIPEKEGRTKKRGKKCLLKVKEIIEEKKKDKKKGKNPKWNTLWSHDNQKKKTKKKSFGRCTKPNPTKKKNCFFNTKPPCRNIHIYR
jgi:hypothetical protein